MILAKETAAQDKEEVVDEEECREEGAAWSARAASEGSTCDRFVASYAALRRIDSLLIAPMT